MRLYIKKQSEPNGVPVPVVPPLVIDVALVGRESPLLIELEGLQGVGGIDGP